MRKKRPVVNKIIPSEEEFYDVVGEQLLRRRDLAVDEPARFLAGSMDAFDYILKCVGPVQGKRILDYGCGSGWLSVYLAKQGAEVEGFDISGKLVEMAAIRASANGVADACNFRKMAAEKLEYPDQCFDLVVGISILHHVELQSAAHHLKRVMRQGALAVFIEPLGENPVLNCARDKVFNVHHGLKKDKRTERPLTYDEIRNIGRNVAEYSWKEFQLLSMARRFIGDRIIEILLVQKLDNWLLSKFSWIRRYCRSVVLELQK